VFCSEGREVLVDLLPITAEGSKDTIQSQRLLEGGIRAVGALIARCKSTSETDPSAAKIVRQITTDNASGLLAAKINISNEAKGQVVQDHCLLHACNNMLKEVFTIPEAKSTLLAVLECIKVVRKPHTRRKYALVREQWNAEVRNSRKTRQQLQLGDDVSLRNQLILLPKEGTRTALKPVLLCQWYKQKHHKVVLIIVAVNALWAEFEHSHPYAPGFDIEVLPRAFDASRDVRGVRNRK